MVDLPFEDAFEQLRVIINTLSDGKIPLDQALQKYQEGMRLVHYCQSLLEQAELTIQQLGRDTAGNITIQPFSIE